MADQNQENQLDDLLKSMLSSYSAAEPRPGLETRILAQVRHATEKKPRLWSLVWAVAIVTILLVAYFSQLARRSHPAALEAVKPVPQSPQETTVPERAIRIPDRSQSVRRVARAEVYTLPEKDRPAVFPTPTPLSEQEKLFFRYLAGTPRDEVITQSHSDEVADGLPEDRSAIPVMVPARQTITDGTR